MDDPNDERRNRLEALAKEAEEMTDRKRELERELKQATEPQKAMTRQLKLLKKEEVRANQSLLEANQRLQARRDEILAKSGSAESDQARRNLRLQAAEAKLVEGKKRHNELKQSITDSLDAYEQLEPEVMAARDMTSKLTNQLRGIEGKLRSMQSSSVNSLDIFGPRCAKVKQMVDKAMQQKKFSGPVLGPIGLFCKIQAGKEEFSSLASCAIGNGVLDRFVVFNARDRKLFQEIRRGAGCQMDCGIFQQNEHSRYPVPEPPQGVETVATVVSIENDLVFNCLVDWAKIDTKALCRGKKESEDLLLVKDRNNRTAIRGGKIKEVYFLPDGDNWKVSGGHKNMISNPRRLKKTIGTDVTSAIKDSKNDHQSVKDELRAKENEFRRLDSEHTEHKTQWNKNKNELRRNERAIDAAAKEIEDVKAEEAANIDNNIDTTEEEEDVSAAQSHLDEIKENQKKAGETMKENTPHIREIKENLDEITSRNEKILRDMKDAEQELSDHYRLIEHQKAKIAKKREKLRQFEDILAGHAEQISEKQKDSDLYLKMARQIQYAHDRSARQRKEREENLQVNDQQSSKDPTEEELELIGIPDELEKLENQAYYEDRINRTDQRIEEEKDRRLENEDDEATAYAKYSRALTIYQAKKDQMKEIESTSAHMTEDTAIRKKRWMAYRDYISQFSTSRFDQVRKYAYIEFVMFFI